MPTFGFSAYLKLICLNSKPQRREVRGRLKPRGGGYDFHKSLRLLANKYLLGKGDAAELMDSVVSIVKDAERNSARSGLEKLFAWVENNPGSFFEVPPAAFKSPDGIFSVNFLPDFGAVVGGKRTAIHIWNTKTPDLDRLFCYGALALFPKSYAGQEGAPDDLAVLSLRDGNLYRLSEAGDVADFGLSVAMSIESLFYREASNLGLSIKPPKRDPHAPPPPPA